MDDNVGAFAETFSSAARETYTRRAEELIAEIRRHVAWTLQRDQPGEDRTFYESAKRVQSAADAFNTAEIGWSDSYPFNLDLDEDDEHGEDEDWEGEESEEPGGPAAGVLTAVGRWTYRITDADAVMAAGRTAYLSAWPDETEDDAQRRVRDVADAVGEIQHAHGFAAIEATPGLEPAAPFPFVIGFGVHDEEEHDATVSVELTEDERTMLVYGLKDWDWDGTAYATNALALVMGFRDSDRLQEEGQRMARVIAAGDALPIRDWTRALLAAEFAFTSDVLGTGREWTTIRPGSEEHWMNVLRSLQQKLPTAPQHLGP